MMLTWIDGHFLLVALLIWPISFVLVSWANGLLARRTWIEENSEDLD